MTGRGPFEIMYGEKMKNKLSSVYKESDVCDDMIREREMVGKEKSYSNCKNNTKVMDVEKDDIVMLKQNKESKPSTRLAPSLYEVVKKKGKSVQIEGCGRSQKRSVIHLKEMNFEDAEEKDSCGIDKGIRLERMK